MKITTDQLTQEVTRAKSRGWLPVFAKAEKKHKLPPGLLLAIASRETDMEDKVGDGGHGRGLFQIDDRSHADFLAQQGASGSGGKPPIPAAADYAAGLLASGIAFGQNKGIGASNLLKFACSAYNAGAGNALTGHQAGDSDKKTTGNDYGKDVLERLAAIQSKNGGAPAAVLQRGSRGPKVTKLKVDLQRWFDKNAPGVYETFAVGPGPMYGPALVKCVSDFQQRNELSVTGAVDKGLLAVLAGKPGPGPTPTPTPTPADVLEKGMRGPAIVRLKRDLQSWFDRATPGEWERLAVAGGPSFGGALEVAVREFQRRSGLFVDGQVGEETAAALAAAAPAPGHAPAPTFADLKFDAPKKRGSKGDRVRLIQCWLTLHNFKVTITGTFDPATETQVRGFQKSQGLPMTGVVDNATYAALVQPMVSALLPLAGHMPIGQLIVAYARQHLAQHPLEVGGPNSGPWVRLYTGGSEGEQFLWCAAFSTFVLDQAAKTKGKSAPFARTLLCDEMQRHCGERLLELPKPSQRARITPGSFFLVRASHGALKYQHTGIVVRADAQTFKTIEGNTNDDGSSNGIEVTARVRNYGATDFIVM